MNETGNIYLETQPDNLDLTDLFAKLLLGGSLPIFDINTVIDKQTSKLILKVCSSN